MTGLQPRASSFLPALLDEGEIINDEVEEDRLAFLTLTANTTPHATRYSCLSINRKLFEQGDILAQIVEKIVIPNVALRESDAEMFEDDPFEYVQRDMEGSDTDSRRRCGVDLLRACVRTFGGEVVRIVQGHVQGLIGTYEQNKAGNWAQKDAAVVLISATGSKAASPALGVTEVTEGVDIIDFFAKQVIPDLQSPPHDMILAAGIKYVTTFRNQFTRQQLGQVFGGVIAALRR